MAIDHGGEGGDDLVLGDAGRKLESEVLGEPIEATGALDHEADGRGQRNRPHSPAGQFLEHLGGTGFHDLGQCSNGSELEHVPRSEVQAAGPGARDQLDGHDAVTAEGEERVVHAHGVDTEYFREHLAQCAFGVGGRFPTCSGLEHRLRQCVPVELAHRGQRHFVHHDDGRGHHVCRKRFPDVLTNAGGVDVSSRLQAHVGHEGGAAGGKRPPEGGHEIDARVGRDDRVDLTELDAESADLDLEVRATHVLDHVAAVALPPAHDVTCSVHPVSGIAERIRDETFGCQAVPPEISPRELHTGEIELAGDAERNRAQARIQNVRRHSPDGPADRQQVAGAQSVADVRHDGGLGRAVAVEEPNVSGPALHQLRRALLTAGDHDLETGHRVGIDRGQNRRGQERVRYRLPRDQRLELAAAVGARWRDHQGGRGGNREEQFENRRVETGRREVQRAGLLGQPVALTLLGREVGQPAMRDHHALGLSGGAGGVDDVCGVVGLRTANRIRLHHWGVRLRECVDDDPVHLGRQ